jgi:hypothetical protein
LVILSLKTLWAGVKHWRTALHRFYVYRKPIDHLHDLAIWKWLKNVYISLDLKCICVWFLDNWSRILSGKPFNLFSMARLKILQFRLTLTPLFTATHAFFSLFHHFFSWSVIGVVPSFLCRRFFFILVTLDLCLLLIHCDLWNSQKWQILIFNLCRDLDLFLNFPRFVTKLKRTLIDAWSLRFKLKVFICRHVVNVPKSSITFRGILICAI